MATSTPIPSIPTPASASGLTTALAAAGDQPRPLVTPFEHVALAFSGGGFRAASFCLGVLSYLDQVSFADPAAGTGEGAEGGSGKSSLLEKIRYISSASGGTITSASFALACAEGRSFNAFFDTLYDNLIAEKVLTRALEMLNSRSVWRQRPDKRRNLINAFALSYDDVLFSGKPLSALQGKTAGGMGVPLEEVCFNSTEFFHGLPFRQNIRVPDGAPDKWLLYGNFYFHLLPEVAGRIRISDALAASSCFPAGFEPLKFPEDFCYDGLAAKELAGALCPNTDMLTPAEIGALQENGWGLMDGGITDNQGLESLMLADLRRCNGETTFGPFDLILVNDVGSQYMNPYTVPPLQKGGLVAGWKFTTLQWIFFGVLPALVLVLGYLGYRCETLWGSAAFFAGAGILLTLTGIFAFVCGKLPGSKTKVSNFSAEIVGLLLRYFKRARLMVIYQMISARASSAIILNTDVFLKRIRKLIYDAFYTSPRWVGRKKGNHVYDLSKTNALNRSRNIKPGITPDITPDLQVVAQLAFEVGTTLWFGVGNDPSLPSLVACGQFNTCYNLLEYTRQLVSDMGKPGASALSPAYQARVKDVQGCLEKHWELFKADPFWMYNQMRPDTAMAVVQGKVVARTVTPTPSTPVSS